MQDPTATVNAIDDGEPVDTGATELDSPSEPAGTPQEAPQAEAPDSAQPEGETPPEGEAAPPLTEREKALVEQSDAFKRSVQALSATRNEQNRTIRELQEQLAQAAQAQAPPAPPAPEAAAEAARPSPLSLGFVDAAAAVAEFHKDIPQADAALVAGLPYDMTDNTICLTDPSAPGAEWVSPKTAVNTMRGMKAGEVESRFDQLQRENAEAKAKADADRLRAEVEKSLQVLDTELNTHVEKMVEKSLPGFKDPELKSIASAAIKQMALAATGAQGVTDIQLAAWEPEATQKLSDNIAEATKEWKRIIVKVSREQIETDETAAAEAPVPSDGAASAVPAPKPVSEMTGEERESYGMGIAKKVFGSLKRQN